NRATAACWSAGTMTSGRAIRRTVPAGSNESRLDDDDAVGMVAGAADVVASGTVVIDARAPAALCGTAAAVRPIAEEDASRGTGADEAGGSDGAGLGMIQTLRAKAVPARQPRSAARGIHHRGVSGS